MHRFKYSGGDESNSKEGSRGGNNYRKPNGTGTTSGSNRSKSKNDFDFQGNCATHGLFYFLEKAAEENYYDDKEKSLRFRRFNGENPAEWLPTRKIVDDMVRLEACMDVLYPGIKQQIVTSHENRSMSMASPLPTVRHGGSGIPASQTSVLGSMVMATDPASYDARRFSSLGGGVLDNNIKSSGKNEHVRFMNQGKRN
jgi:hypothetical protein